MENNLQKTQWKFLFLNVALLMIFTYGIFSIYAILHPVKKESSYPAQTIAQTHIFDNINLEAKAVYVFDIAKNQVIFQKNEDSQLPLASLTKLMMALTASNLLSKNSRITIRPEFLMEEGDNGLLATESWKMKDLLDFSLVVSSNDGARSIASVIGALNLQTDDYDLGRQEFIRQMNVEAQKMNLGQMYFINESGLDEGTYNGGYGSAENISRLMQYILQHKPELLEATRYSTSFIKSASTIHTAQNTNTATGNIPGLLASKTGFTNIAGGNLAVAFDASMERPIIVVVLGSSEKGRFVDVNSLVKASLAYIQE